MLEYLKQLDVKILLSINGLHNPFLDGVMVIISDREPWIPLYILIILFLYLKRKKEFFPALVFIVLATVSSDLFASAFMKPLFQRLRPCHNNEINYLLHSVNNICGGQYGFISSHAANTFALATFLVLYLGKEYKWLYLFFAWAFIVSISRVYLGVHYPGDITVGALAGMIIASLYYYLFRFVLQKIKKQSEKI